MPGDGSEQWTAVVVQVVKAGIITGVNFVAQTFQWNYSHSVICYKSEYLLNN